MKLFGSWGLPKFIEDITSDVFHGVTGIPTAKEKRDQAKMVNDQVQAYKEQTELTRNEILRKQGEEKAEKRRIEAKQIRSLRNNFRPQGLLNSQSPADAVSEKLGA